MASVSPGLNALINGIAVFALTYVAVALVRDRKRARRPAIIAGIVAGLVNFVIVSYLDRSGALDDLIESAIEQAEERAQAAEAAA